MTSKKLMENLIGILNTTQLEGVEQISIEDLKFKVYPVFEQGKTYNSIDDVVRLWAFKDINFEKVEYPIEELVKVLSVVEPKFPLWAHLDMSDVKESHRVDIYISMRFRKPSELRYKEYGFPPFIVKPPDKELLG